MPLNSGILRTYIERCCKLILTNRTGNTGERVIGVPSYQTHRADYQYQDDGEHDRIFGDILALLIPANTTNVLNHTASVPQGEEMVRGTRVYVIMPSQPANVNSEELTSCHFLFYIRRSLYENWEATAGKSGGLRAGLRGSGRCHRHSRMAHQLAGGLDRGI